MTLQPADTTLVRSHAQKNLAFAGKFAAWLKVENYAENTQCAYVPVVADFCRFLGDQDVASITHLQVRLYLTFLHKRGLTSRSLERQMAALKKFFEFLQLGGVTRIAIPRLIGTRKAPRKLPVFPTIEETKRLIETAETPRDRAILEIFYATACRLAEVTNMRCEDIDFQARTIKVLGKGNKERIVCFGRMAHDALLSYLGERREGYLFHRQADAWSCGVRKVVPNPNDEITPWWRAYWREYPDGSGTGVSQLKWIARVVDMSREQAQAQMDEYIRGVNTRRSNVDVPLSRQQIARVIKTCARRAGLKGIHPHSLRHACATHLLSRGVGIREIQELLGHSNVSTTMIYTHVCKEQLSIIHEKFHPRG